VDQFTRECLCLVADQSLTGEKMAQALEPIVIQRGAPRSITVANGGEFASRVMDAWAYRHGIHLDFMVFFTLEDVRQKLARWQEDYNRVRLHSALEDRAPATIVAEWVAATTLTDQETPELPETLT
jgi:putative transposase